MKTAPQPGDVLEFFEQNRIIAGMCLETKKSKPHIITETSRQMNLSPSRILHHSPGRLSGATSKSEAIGLLREISGRRRELAAALNLEEIWSALDAGGSSLSLEDMTDLAFSGRTDADHEAAVVRAILAEKIHFEFRDGQVRVRENAAVDSALRQREEALRKEREKEALIAWIKGRKRGDSLPEPPAFSRFVEALKSLAVNDPEQPHRTWIREILKPITRSTPEDAFKLLVDLAIIDPDENMDFHRFRFPRTFSRECLQELAELEYTVPVASGDNRRDLRDLHSFTVDGPQTRDMDDALSINMRTDGAFELFIHITDVTEFITAGGLLDQEACDRGQTLYLPDETLPMFPQHFTEDTASLKKDCDRLTLTTRVIITPEFSIEEYAIFPAIIRVRERLTYEDLNMRVGDMPFKALHDIAVALRSQRLKSGAIIMPRPELEIRVDENRVISIQRRDRETPGQVVVSEMMILANRLAAETAADADAAFPFRCQKAPRESVPVSMEVFNPYIAYRQRRMMNRAQTALTPSPHFSLGLPAYTNITSPLRRYFDVIAQRQLKAIISGESPASVDDLESTLMEAEAASAKASQISNNRFRYWLFKYIAGQKGKHLPAIVLDRFPNRYQVWLPDYNIDGDIPVSFDIRLRPEQKITVVVESVSPRKNSLRLRVVD